MQSSTRDTGFNVTRQGPSKDYKGPSDLGYLGGGAERELLYLGKYTASEESDTGRWNPEREDEA